MRFGSPHSKAAQTNASTRRGAAFIAATEEVQFAFSPKWRVNQELNADGDQPVSNRKTPTPTTGTDGSSRSNADRNAMESRSGKRWQRNCHRNGVIGASVRTRKVCLDNFSLDSWPPLGLPATFLTTNSSPSVSSRPEFCSDRQSTRSACRTAELNFAPVFPFRNLSAPRRTRRILLPLCSLRRRTPFFVLPVRKSSDQCRSLWHRRGRRAMKQTKNRRRSRNGKHEANRDLTGEEAFVRGSGSNQMRSGLG